jgi:hypothetical protein
VKVNDKLTERDVRRLFSDYGRQRFPSKAADKVELREVRRLVKLQEDIDRVSEGLSPAKSGYQQERASADVRKKRDLLASMLRERAANTVDPIKAAAYNEARVENLRKQIEDLDRMIFTGERVEPRLPRPENNQVIQLKALRKRLKDEMTAIDKPPLSDDERYQVNKGRALQRQMEAIQSRIAANDYAQATRPPVRALNEANTKAAYELQLAKEDFARRQFEWEMKNRPVAKKIFGGVQEGLNYGRALMTSLDLSAVLRQGGFIALGSPGRAFKNFGPMFRAFASKKYEFESNAQLLKRPNASLYKAAGLELTQSGGTTMSKQEEVFMSRWAERTPLVAGSQRAFTVFLNNLRADSFDAMVSTLAKKQTPTDEEARAIASYINVATGRGLIGPQNKLAGQALNTAFFAPRLVASRFNLLAGQPLYGGTARTRQMIAKEYARFTAGAAFVYMLGALANEAFFEEDDKEKGKPFVTFDPRSTDFGKMRFGKTFVDPLGGLAQVTTVTARILSGEKVTATGKLIPLRDKYRYTDLDDDKFWWLPGADGKLGKKGFGGDDTFDIATRFLRTKLAPVPGAIVNTAVGKDVIGEDVTPVDTLGSLVTPLTFGNIFDTYKEYGLPRSMGLFVLELLGMGVQHRAPKENDKQETKP